ncbi:MAG: UvrD-helicase domain-containing protein [Myxococcota bacterium]|nr:UvrD-helicase domain-containing protein [Myxococcota bacterium]
MRLDLSQHEPTIDLQDPVLQLTAAQASACDIQSEILVTAGAGSGKTHTLSLRYVVLLLAIAVEAVRSRPHDPRPDIQRVLVLTFTERAAQEMAQRCYERLLGLTATCRRQIPGLKDAFGEEMAKGLPLALSRLLDRFDEARVSTFHGFCATVHREFPTACETPGDSRIAEAEEAQRILESTLSSSFRDFGRQSPERLRLLMNAFGSRAQIIESAQIAIQKRGRLSEFLQDCAEGRFDINTLMDRASLTPEEVRDWLTHEGLPLLQEMESLLAPSGGGPAFQQHVLSALQETQQALRSKSTPLGAYQAYRSVLASVLTDKGTLRSLVHHSVVGTKASWPDNQHRVSALESLSDLQARIQHWPEHYRTALTLPTSADPLMLEALEALSQLVLMANQRYDLELRERGLLDFDSLQRRAIRAVLDHSHVANALAERHRYIMVDEFQDTDSAQWELVLRLGRPEGISSDRLFLVGDAKQAIYGFRGGDVTVFQAAARELGIQPILFPENFRSRTELIEWFNHFFGSVLGPNTSSRPDWEASHQTLRAARGEAHGTVRLLTHEEPSGPSAATAEALGVAEFLRDQVFSKNGLLGPQAGATKCETPEVAILLRARTHLHLFEEALRLAEIPFQVGGGVGFWARPEIIDLVNVLHALATGDRISTVGALRSPLFAHSDDEIQALFGTSPPSHSFQLGTLTADASPHALNTSRVWSRLHRDRHHLPWPILLREVLVATHAAHSLELSGGARAHANVQRLLEIADQLEANGLIRLDEAAELLLHNVQTGQREAEALVSNDAARVVVLTIHASKGLEFPVVILPGLDARPPANTAPLLCQRVQGRMEMACRVEDPDAALQNRITPGSWHRLSAQAALEEAAERKRLLYVATTRARDHLVLVGGTTRIHSEGNTWMHQLADHHGTEFKDLHTEPLQWSGIGPISEQPKPPPSKAPDVNPMPAAPSTVRLSPSGMDQFRQCPARWYRSDCMGIPEPPRPNRTFPAAATLGSVLHSLLEHSLVESNQEALRLWGVQAATAGANAEQIAAGEAPLLSHLEACRGSASLSKALAAKGYNELAFSLRVGSLEISGVIDRLWWNDETQHWCVLDYKSGLPGSGEPKQPIEGQHLTQLSAYAWAAEKVLDGQVAGPVGPLQICETVSGAVRQVTLWDDAQRDDFQVLLEAISECVHSNWPEVMEASGTPGSGRPCLQCGYFQRGCTGEVGLINS